MKQASNESVALIDAVRSIHHAVSDVIDASICFFGVLDAARQSVNVVWQVQDGVELAGGAFPLGNGLTSQVIRERQPRLVGPWSHQGPRVQVQYATDRPDLPESCITVPVLFEEHVLGVMSVQSYRADAYQPADVELVQRLVARVAPTVAALLHAERGSGSGVVATSNVDRVVAGVVFGFPIDRPQAGRWPLGSPKLAGALRPILDRLEHGESPGEAQIDLIDDGERLVKCHASTVMDGAALVGVIVTLEVAATRAA